MSNWWDDFSKPFRDTRKFAEDIYNHGSRWVGDTSRGVAEFRDKYLPTNQQIVRNAPMGGVGFGINNLIDMAGNAFNRAWNEAHGANRYWLSQIPGFGWGKQMEGWANWYEDYYRHTGIDPKYPQVYGGGATGLVGSMSAATGGAAAPSRWARSLEDLFPPRYQENLSRNEAFSMGYW